MARSGEFVPGLCASCYLCHIAINQILKAIWKSRRVTKMADIDPVLLAVGSVREVVKSDFLNKETAELEDRGHKVTLLTRVGFLQFNLPPYESAEAFPIGAPCVVWLRYKKWNFRGRDGVTLIFESFATDSVAKALAAELLVAA